MTIMDQLSQLLTRQQYLYNKERDVEVRSIVSCHKYKSSFYGMKAKHDHDAKRMLSTYAHTYFFRLHLATVQVYLARLIQMVRLILFGLLDNSSLKATVELYQPVQDVTVYLELSMTVNANMSYVFHPCSLLKSGINAITITRHSMN